MLPQINQILHSNQLQALLETLFAHRSIKILRTIKRCGRSGVTWVYFENQITKNRRATFISFQDLLQAFWLWLETINLLAIALWERLAIDRAIWRFVSVGETVYHPQMKWVTVIAKDLTESKKLPRLWVETSDSIEIIKPHEITIF